MKKLVLTGLLSIALVLAGLPAQAGRGYYHGHGGYGYHDVDGDGLLVAAGIIGGVILLGTLLAPRPYYRPYYRPAARYTPPPVVYVPAYRQRCYRDRVYRYLADGRIQWGVRTTCY